MQIKDQCNYCYRTLNPDEIYSTSDNEEEAYCCEECEIKRLSQLKDIGFIYTDNMI